MPKLHENEIIRLEPNEVAELLDFIESCGDGLSNHQRAYYEKTKERDFCNHYSSAWHGNPCVGMCRVRY